MLNIYARTGVVKNYLTTIWSRVLALLELFGTALLQWVLLAVMFLTYCERGHDHILYCVL